jgi:H+/gluconate symporter-like permease
MNIVGVIGLLVAIVLLIVMVFKGYNVIPVSIFVAIIAIVTNNLGIWEVLSGGYATSMTGFVGNYLIMFFLGAMFGQVLSKSGAAQAIALKLVSIFGSKRALLIVILASAILSYGGISVFVIVFSVYPIAVSLFKEADLPRRLIPGAIMLGAGSFTMTTLPGSPALTNVIPTKYLGTTVTAAPIMGTITAIVMFAAGYFIFIKYQNYMLAKGEHYIPSEFEIKMEEASKKQLNNLPGFGISILPIIAIVAIIFGERMLKIGLPSVFVVVIGLFAGIVVAYILFNKRLEGILAFKKYLDDASSGSITALLNTASIVGFGGAIKATPAFQTFVSFALGLSFSPVISAAIAVNIIAGITGSSSGGITIFMESMAQGFLAQGVNPEALHRISAIGAGVLDSLPHAGPNVTMLAVTHLSYKEGYPGIFFATCVVPFIGLVTAILLYFVGIV